MIQFNPPANKHVPINPLLQCGEQWIHDHDQYEEEDDDGFHGPITFHVQLPGDDNMHRLNFNCRDKSSGVLLPSEPSVTKEDTFDGPSDPFFFEKGFYLEAKTGFQVWPGSRLMVEAFTTCSNSSSSLMEELSHNSIGERLNILEVGAGIGVVGSCLAAAGGNVLITDLPVLVEHGIGPNLRRNDGRAYGSEDVDEEEECIRQQPCPKFLLDTSTATTYTSSFDAVQIGKGWAKAAVLDWFKPVEEQLPLSTTSDIDVIVACDCIFLRKLANPLLTTIAAIFEHSRSNNHPKKFFFTFQRRNMMGLFIQLEELLGMIEERGWTVECVACRDVHVEDDGVHQNYLFQVTPSSANNTDSLDDNVRSYHRETMNVALVEEEKKE
jgi:predicted nicotinamide N-methyase